MNDIFSLPFLNSEIIAQRFIYFSDQLLFGKLIVYPLFQMKTIRICTESHCKGFPAVSSDAACLLEIFFQ